MDDKAVLQHYLARQRADLVGKLDGLGEYDARRPLTPTGTNLLGVVKHVASVQLGYLGEVFDRPSGIDLAWSADDALPDADLWCPADERREDVIALHHASAAHADGVVAELPLDAPGDVPWWGSDGPPVTLHLVLVHLCVETARHAGHADVLRELLDGAAGGRPGDGNLTDRSVEEWAAHRAAVEAAAVEASSRAGSADA